MNFSNFLPTSVNSVNTVRLLLLPFLTQSLWAGDGGGKQIIPSTVDSTETSSFCDCAPCPSALAPIGVMGEHTHRAGGLMLSYRAMLMSMGGHRQGTDSLTSHEVHDQGFNAAATEMDMEMHMLGLMWAPTDRLTFMVMGNYLRNDMTLVSAAGVAAHGTHLAGSADVMHGEAMHLHMAETTHEMAEATHMEAAGMGHTEHTASGATFGHDSEGWGDTEISALYRISEVACPVQTHLHLGLSLPTGSTDFSQHGSLLPYGMQLGSGTYDLKFGATTRVATTHFSWGAQALGTLRMDDSNAEGYALGDRLDATLWATRPLHRSLGVSARLAYTYQDEISGHYSADHPHNAPPHFTDNYGGHLAEAGLGLSFFFAGGQRIAAEYLTPVFEDLNGVGMERDHRLVIGWQWGF